MSLESVTVLPATPQYADRFALRDADKNELRALDATADPTESVRASIQDSYESWMAVTENGEIIAMWGCREFEGDNGEKSLIPWLLGSEKITLYPASLVRLGREYVARLDRRRLTMWNLVHVENAIAQGWLEVLGFTVNRGVIYTMPGGGKFFPFTRGPADV